jgi:hypothetical protein
MRPILILFFLAAGAAHARDCEPPEVYDETIRGLRDFAECAIAEIADLKREQAGLQDKIDTLEKALADVPGRLSNDNGRVTRSGGDTLARADFAVDGRVRQGAAALDIDQKVLEELCSGGCSFTLVLTAVGLRAADPAPVFAVGPCVLQYKPESGIWARSGACGETVTGVDGDGAPTGSPGGEIIAAAGSGCILADSAPRRTVDPETETLGPDRKQGLFLIADAALWQGEEDRFRCDLRFSR